MRRTLSHVADPTTARLILEEQKRRETRDKSVLFDRTRKDVSAQDLAFILNRCHDKQRDLLLNESRFKALICPRRTGKTTYNLYEVLAHDKRFPGSMIAYIVPDSKAHAKDLFWLPLMELNKQLELGLTFKEVEKRVITPNGTNIVILGAHDKDSVKRLRGNPWSLVLLDECKDFGPHFEELVVEAVLPGLGDYGGTLCLSGTPGNVFQGLFYRITTTNPEGWEVVRWIKSDNTFLRAAERDLQQVWETSYRPFGIAMDSPKFRREQKAEWVTEDSERAYYYDSTRNYFSGELNPLIEYDYICAIDIGKRDKLVIQPAAFSAYDPNLIYLETFAERGMMIETFYQKWKELDAAYHFVGTVVDTGGLGVMIVDDINMRYGTNWQAAKKGAGYKLGAVEQLNNDLMLGRIKARPDSGVAQAWSQSIKCPKTGLPLHSDECDAALYLHRFSFHWQGETQEPQPQVNSPQWWRTEEAEAIAHALKNRRGDQSIFGKAVSDE